MLLLDWLEELNDLLDDAAANVVVTMLSAYVNGPEDIMIGCCVGREIRLVGGF